jgi:hypothetical protein
MSTMNLTRATVVAAGLVATGCDGCEGPECLDNSDCSLGETCSDEGTCFVASTNHNGGGGGGGNNNGGEGEGEGEPLSVVQLEGSLTTLQAGDLGPLGVFAGQPDGTVLVGLYEASARDEVIFFNPATGAMPRSNARGSGFNFFGAPLVDAGCQFDHASVQAGYGVDALDELWLSCAGPKRVLQVRSASFDQQIIRAAGPGADFVIALGADIIDTNVTGRRVYAARGGDTLYVERHAKSDNVESIRELDDTPDFGAIAGLTLVATDNADAGHGDLVAVFDRAWPDTGRPALVIVERQSQLGDTRRWEVYTDVAERRHVLELPAATHAVRLGAIADPQAMQIDSTLADTVNLEVYQPVAGRVEFGRYEEAIVAGGTFSSASAGGFNPILLTRGTLPTTTPPASDRILLLPAGNDAVFYVLTNTQAGWRVPLHRRRADARDNDLRSTNFINASPNGLAIGMVNVPGDTNTAWVGMKVAGQVGQDQLVPAVFDQ